MKPSAQRSPGRARSEDSRAAILNAALKLLETQSLQQISIEAIAREAGVGKTTIYRWWPSKATVVIEAFVMNHVSRVTAPKDMQPVEALVQIMQLLIKEYNGWEGRIVKQVLGEGQSDPDVLREFRERFWNDRRALTQELVNEACRRGALRDDFSPEFILELMFAPIYFRLLLQTAPLNKEFAESYCDNIIRLMAPPAAASTATPARAKAKVSR